MTVCDPHEGVTPADFGLSDEHCAPDRRRQRVTRERISPVAAAGDSREPLSERRFEPRTSSVWSMPACPRYGCPVLGELENALIASQLAYGCTGVPPSLLANTLALTPIKLFGPMRSKR